MVAAHNNTNGNAMLNGNGDFYAPDKFRHNDIDDEQQFSSLNGAPPTTNAKYSLLQFAIQHFRDE